MSIDTLHFPRADRRLSRGVTLLEALIALVVMALGMLSFVALQGRLRMNSDVSKQRSEAVRIAEEDIENFRAYGKLTIAADANRTGSVFSYQEVASGTAQKSVLSSSVVQTTNAIYTVNRTISASSVAEMKDVQVAVSWVDRDGVTQRVAMRTFVVQSDPATAAALAISPDGSPVRNALDRSIQIPIPAKSLGDGTSVIKPTSGGTVAYIFNNETGLVTQRCQNSSNASTTTQQFTSASVATAGCTSISGGAYLVSGFIRFNLNNNPSEVNANAISPAGSIGSGGIAVRMDLNGDTPPTNTFGAGALRGSAGWPSLDDSVAPSTDAAGVMTPSGTYPALPECNAEALHTVVYDTPLNPPVTQTNNGVTQTFTQTTVVGIIPQSILIANNSLSRAAMAPHLGIPVAEADSRILNPSEPSTPENYVGYTCLVYPQATTTPRWFTARTVLRSTSLLLRIASTSSTYKVCRYSADYNLNGYVLQPDTPVTANVTAIDNNEHPYAYMKASQSLSNQNFLIIRGNENCPSGTGNVEVNGQGGENYTDTRTVTHQP